MKNITHDSCLYKYKRRHLGRDGRHNGAYYYSIEIVNNIMPLVSTDRPWVTVNTGQALDRAIVIIHNNIHPEVYNYLRKYKDLILVCNVPETCEKVKHLGTPIYIPLSVDVEEVKKYVTEKTNDVCFYGRKKKTGYDSVTLPDNIPIISGMPRADALRKVATYTSVYAVGRAAIEAKILGCNVLPYDMRYPDPDVWQILDNRDAAKMLQEKLDEIDGVQYENN